MPLEAHLEIHQDIDQVEEDIRADQEVEIEAEAVKKVEEIEAIVKIEKEIIAPVVEGIKVLKARGNCSIDIFIDEILNRSKSNSRSAHSKSK